MLKFVVLGLLLDLPHWLGWGGGGYAEIVDNAHVYDNASKRSFFIVIGRPMDSEPAEKDDSYDRPSSDSTGLSIRALD